MYTTKKNMVLVERESEIYHDEGGRNDFEVNLGKKNNSRKRRRKPVKKGAVGKGKACRRAPPVRAPC